MSKIVKVLSLTVVFIFVIFSLVGCGTSNLEVDDTGATKLSFSYSSLKDVLTLNNQKVTITGYMSILTPLDGNLCYLVNLPLQNCPFCAQNSNELSTTMAVQFKNPVDDIIEEPIKVVGTLTTGDFTDDYGYQYSYKIVDATYEIMDENNLPKGYSVYYTLSTNDDIYNLYAMMNCIDTYAYYEYYDLTSETVMQLPPIDLEKYNYTDMLSRIKSYNNDEYKDFIDMIEECKTLEVEINEKLEKGTAVSLRMLQPKVDTLYNNFNSFITKYTM